MTVVVPVSWHECDTPGASHDEGQLTAPETVVRHAAELDESADGPEPGPRPFRWQQGGLVGGTVLPWAM